MLKVADSISIGEGVITAGICIDSTAGFGRNKQQSWYRCVTQPQKLPYITLCSIMNHLNGFVKYIPCSCYRYCACHLCWHCYPMLCSGHHGFGINCPKTKVQMELSPCSIRLPSSTRQDVWICSVRDQILDIPPCEVWAV